MIANHADGYRVLYYDQTGKWAEFPDNGDSIIHQIHWVAGWGFEWRISLPLI